MFRVMLVAGLVALPSAVLAASPPVMSVPRAVPGDGAIAGAPGVQHKSAVSKGGDQYLVVWEDRASTISDIAWEQTESDIVGIRLDASGQPIDATPFTISRNFGYQRRPEVVWTGESWVVAWENQSPTAGYYESRILAALVSTDGEVIGAPFEPFPTNGGNDFHMASNGSTVVFVTQSYNAGEGGLLARQMNSDGSFVGGTVILAPETYYLYFFTEIQSAGGEYLLTYNADTGPVVRRFSSTLQPIGGPVSIPGRRFIASNGSQYLLVFEGGPFGNTLLASPMSIDGLLVVPGGTPLHDQFNGAILSVDAAYSEGTWWLAYEEAWNGLSYQRMTDAGALLDPSLLVYPGVSRDRVEAPKVAPANGGGVVTVWDDYRSINGIWPSEIYTGKVSSPQSFTEPEVLSLAAPSQMSPEIAAGPGHYLLTFASQTSAGVRIMAQRIAADGIAIDDEPVEVASVTTVGGSPAAAWNGASYLVVWSDGLNIAARRLSETLDLLGEGPLTLMPGSTPDVAALGENFLVATTSFATYPQFRDTWVRRVSGEGELMDAGRIYVGGGYAQFSRVETFDGRWLVCWQNNWTHDSPNSDLVARFVGADGVPGASVGVTSTSGASGHPDIAIGPEYALFVWRQNTLANANNDVMCRRIRPDGTSPDTANVMVSNAPYRQLFPVATWTGDEYFMAWDDRRNATTFFDARDDIYGSRISSAGAVVDPGSVAIFDDERPEITPAIASLGNGRFLVAASVFRDEVGLQGYRIAVRAGGPICPSDLDGDGQVGFGDLNLILSNFGLGSPGAENTVGDVNGDGVVNFTDLNEVLAAYGVGC